MSGNPLNPRRSGRSPFDEIMHTDTDPERGPFEWWSARELQTVLGYDTWRNFREVIEDAKHSCRHAGHQVLDHFVAADKMVSLGSGASRAVEDFHLTRYGCYLVAMNGSPRKREIAAAQQYFAIQTYRAEQALPPLGELPRTETVHPQIVRPWANRFDETFGDHYRYVQLNHPIGSFTVVTAGLMQMLLLEDQLLLHLMPVQSGDRPCVSMGKTWANWLRDTGKGERIGHAPLYLPDQRIMVDVAVYGSELLVTFQFWLHSIYLPTKLHPYIDRKKEFTDCGPLPRASVADNACRRLTGRPATLPTRLAVALEDRGGFVPYRPLPPGATPPALPR